MSSRIAKSIGYLTTFTAGVGAAILTEKTNLSIPVNEIEANGTAIMIAGSLIYYSDANIYQKLSGIFALTTGAMSMETLNLASKGQYMMSSIYGVTTLSTLIASYVCEKGPK
jgi:hypothetical protein